MELPAYLIAWCLYLLSALGIVIVFWRMTRNLKLQWRRTRRALRAFTAVVLFTPLNIIDGELWLAPAYLVGLYDVALGNMDKAYETAMFMGAAFVLMVAVILLESVLRRLFGMGRA